MSKRQTKSDETTKTSRKTAASASKKAVAKSSVKPAASKKPAPKKTAAKTPAPKKPATRKETVATLREHVDSIVTRLKTADTNTRKSVKSLENAIAALEKQVQAHQSVDHAELSQQVEQLASHLTRTIDNTKRDISADLRSALENPTIIGVEAAIERSEQRLANTELAQAQALAKVNKHLAELARVIDARFRNQEGETKENAAKINALETKVTQSYERISLIENTAADAIRKVGDEVVGTAETFQSKLEAQNAALRERIEAIAARTQDDFDQQKTDLSRRMESIEDSQKNQSNYIDRSISKLAARIDSLEFGLSNLPEPAPAVTPPVILPGTPDATPASPQPAVPPMPVPMPAPISVPSPQAVDHEPVTDAFAPVTQMPVDNDSFAYGSDTASSPYEAPPYEAPLNETEPFELTEQLAETPEEPVNIFDQMAASVNTPAPAAIVPPPPAMFTDSGTNLVPPQEFQPQQAVASIAPQHHYVDPAQAAPYAPPPQGQLAYDYDSNPAYTEAAPQAYDYSAAVTPGQPVEYSPAIAEEDLPYENPGYGEQETAEGLSRPGHVTGIRDKKKAKKGKKFNLKGSSALSGLSNLPITPRNLRVAGLAVALAVVGYMGLRGFMGGDDAPNGPDQLPTIASTPPAMQNNAGGSLAALPPLTPESDISTSAPIGDYQDNSAAPSMVAFNGDQTLEDAAKGGNAIAQFQLGISYLDAGRTKDGLGYIRKAANQGQPAAQYRLAKLYEAGIGVAADPDMARQLTERAARSGNRIAMHDLGLYYAEGRGGVERNLTTALSWFEKAAERGVVDSQYNLGILFGSTPEIPKDLSAAYLWFSVASTQGDQHAGNQLGTLKSQLSADQLKKAEARVASFKPVAIDEAANGIFREVPWSMPAAENFKPTADLVRDAQSLLGQLGYDVGVPDGDMGPKTRNAVKAFEKANGLPESGAVTGSLVDRLEAAAGV